MNSPSTAAGGTSTAVELRAILAEAVQDADALREAVGTLVVSTSAETLVGALQGLQGPSVYDKAGTLTLLADRIPTGQAVEIFGAELARWVGPEAAEAVLGQGAAPVPVDLSGCKPGEWGIRDGLPSMIWWRHGVAAKGEPSVVQHVQKYASDADRIAAYQSFTNPEAVDDRKVGSYRDPNLVYETGSDDTFWNSQVWRNGEKFDVWVYDADGDRRTPHEGSFADQRLAVDFAEQSVLRATQWAVSNKGKVDLVARSVPSLNEFRESKRFVTDLQQITGAARDHQVRAFHFQGDLFLRLSARDATCSIEVKQKNWGGQNAVYELPGYLAEGEAKGLFALPPGAAGVAPGSIVCSQGQDGNYTLTSFHRLAFESGMRALEEILYEHEFLRERVPAQAAELALRAVYERSPEYSDPQLGGGDFMLMVEKFAQEPFCAYHHLAKHLQHLSDKAFENFGCKADDPSPGM